MQRSSDPEQILATLNEEQRAAAMATTGPVAILAGAGTGKTRVISHRVAYAAAIGAADPRRMLVVTFTEKAAAEMQNRLRRLGLPQVAASTFHAAARRQLAHFWPRVHGRALPAVLDSKLRILAPLARQLPGGYRFTPVKDLTDEIEWAKNNRLGPDRYEAEASRADRDPPLPIDLLAKVYRRYEQAKRRANVIDFEDMLALAIELYEGDGDSIGLVRTRYAWFSVDEYQDTNRLQEDLLRLWLGDRDDLCVVGDADQMIYSFTGASAEYLTGFHARHPSARVLTLTTNYRSTPQVLGLANRLIAATGRHKDLRAVTGDGPQPTITAHPTGEAELAAILGDVRRHLADGVDATEIGVLVRTNAQLVPLESAFTRAGIAFTLRGIRFYARPEVRAARSALRKDRTDGPETSEAAPAFGNLSAAVAARWRTALGFSEDDPEAGGSGSEARDRHASLLTLLGIARELEAATPGASVTDYLAELDRRDAAEAVAAVAGGGVTLSTLHRAKGLEWDAVYLPMLEEGSLPISQALDDPEALAEERRLLYVGITRARRHLALSWAADREGAKGGRLRGMPSRFLVELGWTASRTQPLRARLANRRPVRAVREPAAADDPLLDRLRAWRLERSRADEVPAYVVADNKTLAAVAERRPATMTDLLAVPGIGRTKAKRYGADIIRIIGEAGGRGALSGGGSADRRLGHSPDPAEPEPPAGHNGQEDRQTAFSMAELPRRAIQRPR